MRLNIKHDKQISPNIYPKQLNGVQSQIQIENQNANAKEICIEELNYFKC